MTDFSVFEADPNKPDPIYEANPRQIGQLINAILSGKLGLPDFQRDFTWEQRRTAELLTSIMRRFPAGTLLFWDIDKGDAQLKTRSFQGLPDEESLPDQVVLDGQQRLTSLLHSLARGGLDVYFVNLNHLVLDDWSAVRSGADIDEWEEVIFYISRQDEKSIQEAATEKWQYDNAALPLPMVWKVDDWIDGFLSARSVEGTSTVELKAVLRELRDTYLHPLTSYGFPIIDLPAETQIEAVCTVFETLNRTAKPLGVFELLTARFFPKNVFLRDLWDDAIEQYPVLDSDDFSIDPYSVLQAVSLRARNSAQRSHVLKKLKAEEVAEHWGPVVEGFVSVLEMLGSECGVLTRRLLPYGMLLVPMAAVWPEIAELSSMDRGPVGNRLRRFFWCSVFTSNYDQGANSQAGADYIRLKSWLFDESAEPPESIGGVISAASVATATTRRKALYSGLLALSVREGARDFHDGEKITRSALLGREIDSHHIFPKAHLAGESFEESPELILNRALIDKVTNQVIGKKPPSQYVGELDGDPDRPDIATVFSSHFVNATAGSPLLADDYSLFLEERLTSVLDVMKEVTGLPVEVDQG